MKIAVVGAGAMGSLFGAMLAEAGNEVWLYDVWVAHVQGSGSLEDRGLRLEAKPSAVGGLRLEVRGKKFCEGNFGLQPIAKRSSNLKRPKALPQT